MLRVFVWEWCFCNLNLLSICLNIWTWENIRCSLSLVNACSLLTRKKSSGKDKLHQNSITVMRVAELAQTEHALRTVNEDALCRILSRHICYEGAEQHHWILPHLLPDLVQLNSPPFRQQNSSEFKGCKVTQNLCCGHEDTHSFEVWSRGHSQI